MKPDFLGEKKRNWWPNLVKWTKIGPETKFFFAIFSSLQGVSQALFDDVYVIFPIHVNFSITSRCVLKATVHRKKQWIVLRYLRKFSSKRCFYDMILYIDVAFEFFHFITICPYFSCFFIYHLFRHITFYTRDSFSIFIRGFPFSSFPSMFEISARTYCYF